jgi:LuxR family maltose regulon positive regulatory protein
VRRADASFSTIEAAFLTIAGHAVGAEQVLRALHDNHHVSPGRAVTLSAIRSVWVDDHLPAQQAREAADRATQGFRALPPDDFRPAGDIITAQNVTTIAAVTRSRADWYVGRVSAARRSLFDELESGDTSPLSRLHLFGALALMESWNGVLTVAEHFAAQARELATESLTRGHPYLVPAELALAHVLIEQQSLDDAAAVLDRVNAMMRVVTHSAWQSMLAQERAWLALASHAPRDGLAALAQDTTETPLRPLLDARRRTLTARLFLALDDAARAEHELAYDPATATAGVAGVAAQLALVRQDLPRAREVVNAWPDERAEQDQIVHALWVAVVALAGGDRVAALAAAEEAIELGAAGQHVRVFLDAGPVARPLLDVLARHDKTGYVASVVLAERGSSAAGDAEAASSLLTPRELGVLRQLAERRTYAEIAEALFISQNTVKTHAKSVYMKLGASGRRDAVLRAEQLGLL